MDPRVTRRALLSGALLSGAAVGAAWWSKGQAHAAPPAMPVRRFGATGKQVSVFGLGCFYLGTTTSDAEAAAVVHRALDKGCTYFDTAPSYARGSSERRLGLALAGARDRVFLASKTLERDGKAARKELDETLKRLGTSYLDLIQIHCVRDVADLEVVLSDKGPLPALARAREAGLVRHIGVSGHEDPAVMARCLEAYPWASVLLPLNPVDLHGRSFLKETLPVAVRRDIARVGMKVFASGRLVRGDGAPKAEDCLRFAYALDVATVIVGCASVTEVDLAARVAAEDRPLSPEARATLIEACRPYVGRTGAGVEWYKRTN